MHTEIKDRLVIIGSISLYFIGERDAFDSVCFAQLRVEFIFR